MWNAAKRSVDATALRFSEDNRLLRRLEALLVAFALVSFAVALVDRFTDGFHITVFGVRVSSWEAYKPFRNGVIAAAAWLCLRDRRRGDAATWNLVVPAAPWIAAAVALGSMAAAIALTAFAAGGADAYCYVTQASLWASGRLVVPDRLAMLAPAIGQAVAPLGYQLADGPAALVPICSPGLPLVMAAALMLGAPSAIFYVVPIFTALAVWLTYVVGLRAAGPHVGLMAAVLFAFSPIFLFQAIQPMSDVPATAWWLAAWAAALAPGAWTPLAAGIATTAAILTRPNIAPLALVLVPVVAWSAPRTRRLALFVAAVVPGCLFIGIMYAMLYGSPVRSGYGPLDTLFAFGRGLENLRRYTTWLLDLHTPGILLAFAAPLVSRTRRAWAMLAFFGVALSCYIFYFIYEDWPFLRFLLPALPLLFVLGSDVVVRGLRRAPLATRGAALLLVCALGPCWYVLEAQDLGLTHVRDADRRYATIGAYAGRMLPTDAAVVSVIHSGSVRLYGGRTTLRWDAIERDRFDATVDVLEAAGYQPYLLLEDWEEDQFRARFSDFTAFGRLDWPPAFEYLGPGRARIYRLGDRARRRAGECVLTQPIPEG
jgi:hypothetical protein